MQTKICTKCNKEKNIEFYNRSKATKDGYVSQCKECKSEYFKERRKQNRDQLIERDRLYYQRTHQERLQSQKRYRDSNKEKIKESQKRYYEKNQNKVKERRKGYYTNNSEANKERGWKRALRIKYNITVNDYNEMLTKQNGTCAICKTHSKRFKLSIDHNHETGQIRGLLCGNCNRAIGLLRENPNSIRSALDYLYSYLDADFKKLKESKLSGSVTTLSFPIAQLRHLYYQMTHGYVQDTDGAAKGLLGPAIEWMEEFEKYHLEVVKRLDNSENIIKRIAQGV